MRFAISLFSLLIFAALVTTTAECRIGGADVSATWVPDPMVGDGGYVELSIANNSGRPVYIIAVGDNGAGATWQVWDETEVLQPDELLVGLRYLLGEGAKRARDVYGPIPYLALGNDGEILGSGMTSITGVVPTEISSFGRVKQLFLR